LAIVSAYQGSLLTKTGFSSLREANDSRAGHPFEDGVPGEPQESADVLKELGLILGFEAAILHPADERADLPLSPLRGVRGHSAVRERPRDHTELATPRLVGQVRDEGPDEFLIGVRRF